MKYLRAVLLISLLLLMAGCTSVRQRSQSDHKTGAWFLLKSYQVLPETWVQTSVQLPPFQISMRFPEYFEYKKKYTTATMVALENLIMINVEAKFFDGKIYYNWYAMAHEMAHVLYKKAPNRFPDPHDLFP